ncbi:hypothetical protein PLCT2_02335 [Planctomycetaceae bacterium]|nr:hypothetical protein PLCT2_02335 [Planctomycetaceae bacterium]
MASKSILALFALCAALLAASTLGAATMNVTLSGASPANFENRLSDTSVEVTRFVLTSTGAAVDCSAVTITFTNPTTADEAFTAVRVFYDANGNSSFEAGEEIGVGQAPNGAAATLSFTGAFTVPTSSRLMQVIVNTGANVASYGSDYRFSIAAAADITLVNPGTDSVTGAFPVQGNTLTIRNSVTNLLAGTGNPAGPRTVVRGSQDVAGAHFRLDCIAAAIPGELVGLDLSSITVSLNLGSAADASVITSVSLFGDDFDAAFEPSGQDPLIQSRTSADIAKWTVAGSTLTVIFDGAPLTALTSINSGTVRAFWIGVSFNSTANAVVEVLVNRTGIIGAEGANGDFMTTAITSVSGNVITVSGSGGGGGDGQGNRPSEEGGCTATPTGVAMPWILLVLLAAAIRIIGNRKRPNSTV